MVSSVRVENGNHERQADLVISDVLIIDGKGLAPRHGSILVKDGVIVEVDYTNPLRSDGQRVIEGKRSVAAPGFIDTHIHSDVDLLWNRQHAATLSQGVTTHILGQDGLSYAPLSQANLALFREYLSPVNGLPPISWNWSSVAEFRERFDRKVSVNTAYLVPHGTLRFEISGMSQSLLDKNSLDSMCALLRKSLEEGGAGFSTGLSYFPGSYADTSELIALCRVLKEFDRPYVTHTRSVFSHGYVEPIAEAVNIARETGVKVHISHWRTTGETVGHVDQMMATIDAAYNEGVDITLDTYPYFYGSGPLYIGLPAWAFEGGLKDTLARLANPDLRQALITGIEENKIDVSQVMLTYLRNQPEYAGIELPDLASRRHQSIPDLICDLLLDNELDVGEHMGTKGMLENESLMRMSEADCLNILDRPYTMIGSDGIYVGRSPHERGFGTFARLIRLAREHKFPLEKLINRMSSSAARRFSLQGRGIIEAGAAADLVVFNPLTTRECSSPQYPRRGPIGISLVTVNGEIAVEEGMVTGLFAGRAVSPE